MSNPHDPYRPPERQGGDGPSEPRYGARSDKYGQPTPYEPAASSERPWPTYQQTPHQPNAEPPGHGQPSYGQPNQGQAAPNTDPYRYTPSQTGAPGGYPSPGPYPPGSPTVQSGPAPSRALPILTMIGGIVLMVVVAPIIFVVLVLQGFGFSQIMDGSMTAIDGGPITVDDTGAVGVALATGMPAYGCVLEGAGGTHELTPEPNFAFNEADVLTARGLQPGQYTLHCENATPGTQYTVFPGEVLNNLMPMSLKAFGWASLAGVTGLAAAITGLVWLIRRNRAIRQYYGRY